MYSQMIAQQIRQLNVYCRHLHFMKTGHDINRCVSKYRECKSEYSQVPLLDRSAPFMEDIYVTKEGVTKLLKGLNPSKALGPDELHPRVLKELATELGPIFVHLF